MKQYELVPQRRLAAAESVGTTEAALRLFLNYTHG